MAMKKKDLSEVTSEEAAAHLDALFCQGYATGRRFRYFYPYSMYTTYKYVVKHKSAKLLCCMQ